MNVERNLLIGTIATMLVVILLGIAYAGEETRMAHETKAQQGELIARGARLYDTYCAGCHGRRGEGLPGIYPPLNVEDLWVGREDIAFYGTLHDYIALNISAGHPKQRMPSWADEYGGPLRNDQIEDLTQFVLNWMGPQPEGVRLEFVPIPTAVAEPGPTGIPSPVAGTGITPTAVAGPTPAGTPAPVVGMDTARGGQIFATACARCHGADGRGTELGPSLISDRVAAKGDDVLRDIIANGKPGTSMPSWGGLLSSQDITNVVTYLRALAEGEAPAAPPTPAETAVAGEPLVTLPAGDPLVGRALFTGVKRLQNGGPPCLACHSVAGDAALGGGTLAPDLTSAFNDYGEIGLAGVLAEPLFPGMKPVYEDRPLTSEEQMHLRTFLQTAAAQQPTRPTGYLGLLALGGFLALMVLTWVVWRRRLRGVRRFLVEGIRRSVE